MTREEVIRGLECCKEGVSYTDPICGKCPYREEGVDCVPILAADALLLLKAQETVAPVLQSGGNYVCGNCGMYTVGFMHPLTGESVQTWKYCPACGRKVRWE